jgi:hypothetical protein
MMTLAAVVFLIAFVALLLWIGRWQKRRNDPGGEGGYDEAHTNRDHSHSADSDGGGDAGGD